MRLENMSLKQPPSYSRPSNSPGLWKVEDVVLWARQAKLSEAVLAALTENEIDGPTLITLNKGDLRLELGILSLPARRHLWDLVQSLRKEQDARDFKAAIQVHEEEITSFSRATPQEGGAPSTESVIPEQTLLVQELVSDARRESQVVEDHLLALRLQRDLMENTGSSVYRDAEVAQEKQRRLNDLHATAQEDFSFAETLLTPRQRETAAAERRRRHDMSQASTGTIQLAGRFRKSQQRLNEDNSSKGSHEVNRVSSLFGLSMKVCAGNKINVAQAFTSGAMTPIPSAAIVSSSDDEDDRDQKPAAEELPSTHSLPRINTCHVCYIDNVRGYSLACGHLQCISCTRKLFKTTLRDTSLLPLRCCDVPIDMNIAHELLKESEASLVFQRLAEQIAVNKMYCPTCSTFLNLDLIDTSLSQDLTCDCGTQLCIACKTETHPGFTCAENLSAKKGSDELILELSKQKGWKQCPKCSAMIELRSGCNHMTCFSCKHQFCFVCLRHWDAKTSRCSSGTCEVWEESRLTEAGEARVQQEEAAQGEVYNREERRDRVRQAIVGLRNNEDCFHEWTTSNGFKGDCPNCGFTMYAYGMRCRSDCGSIVCYTCAHHRLPQHGWR